MFSQVVVWIVKTERRPILSILFIDDDQTGMLEAVNIKKLDMILRLICECLADIYAEPDTCSIKALFTEYVEVMNQVYSHNGRSRWTTSYITKLRRDINNLKLVVVRVFSSCQKSRF